jgi:hypothetical protein
MQATLGMGIRCYLVVQLDYFSLFLRDDNTKGESDKARLARIQVPRVTENQKIKI